MFTVHSFQYQSILQEKKKFSYVGLQSECRKYVNGQKKNLYGYSVFIEETSISIFTASQSEYIHKPIILLENMGMLSTIEILTDKTISFYAFCYGEKYHTLFSLNLKLLNFYQARPAEESQKSAKYTCCV